MLFLKNNKLLSLSILTFLFFVYSGDANASVEGANGAAAVLCDVILLFRGRIGRAIAIFSVMSVSWSFIIGNADWQKLTTIVIGCGLLFGAEGFAYIILPSVVTGVSGVTASGKIFLPDERYSPQEIVKYVCPELSRF